MNLERFHPIEGSKAGAALVLPADAPVLVSAGGLCERKRFTAISIACRPCTRGAWDRGTTRQYTHANTWDHRVDVLEAEFRAMRRTPAAGAESAAGSGDAQRT